MKTYVPNAESIPRQWHLIDAQGKVLGRLASQVAHLLRGKHKPTFVPHLDMGDHVVVINAAGIVLTGNKLQQKKRYWHSGYPGGIKSQVYADFMEQAPEEVLRKAVRGMLPKNRLGRKMLGKLKVYRSNEHPHEAQQPVPRDLSS